MPLPYTKLGTNTNVVLSGDEFMAEWIRPKEFRNKDKGSKIVLINGAFDLMHPGHMEMFKVAKDLAGKKGKGVCGLDSDDKIAFTKGKGRPIYNFFIRAKMVSYIGADFVVEIEDELDFMDLVQTCKPSVRVLGSEYKDRKSRIPHIPCVFVERPKGAISTTEVIRRCQECLP